MPTRPTLGKILIWIEQTLAAVGPTALPAIEAQLAAWGIPAWELSIIDAVLKQLLAGAASASFRIARDTVPPADLSTLAGTVVSLAGPVQADQAAAAKLPGDQAALASAYQAFQAAIGPLLPAAPPA